MKFINQKQHRIHPEDRNEIRELADRWGISMRQLNEAIVDTGSIDREQLKMHLRKKGLLHFSFTRWLHAVLDASGLEKLIKA